MARCAQPDFTPSAGPSRSTNCRIRKPGPGEQLVDIAYASVNPLDVWITQGSVGAAGANLPWTPGTEATGHADGRAVLVRGGGLGVARPGVYCNKIAVPDAWLLPIPDGLDLAQVAAMPVAGITAWMSLHSRAHISALDRVLILGASGGVGAVAIQLAKAVGATVWGQTGSANKVDGITANGADNVIVAGPGDIEEAVASYEPTVILDSLGGPYTDAAIACIANKGRLVVFGTSNDQQVSINLRRLYRKGVSLLGYAGLVDTPEEQRDAMDTLMAMMAAGSLKVPVGDVLPLTGAAEAHARILGRRGRGKAGARLPGVSPRFSRVSAGGGPCPQRLEASAHVDDVVHRVVQEVPPEGLDGERRAVAAKAGALPLVRLHGVVQVAEDGCPRRRSRRRPRAGPAGRSARRSLTRPGPSCRSAGCPRATSAAARYVAEPEHVADVTCVLERRPAVVARTNAHQRIGEELRPRLGRFASQAPNCSSGSARRIEPALLALALEHPRPVLRLRFDRHVANVFDGNECAVADFTLHSSCSASSRNSSGTERCLDSTTPA